MSDGYKIDGVNVSILAASSKRHWNGLNFYRLTQKFPIVNIIDKNGITYFEMNGVKYAYAPNKNKIRKVGEKIWNSSPTKYLRSELNKNINDLLNWIDL